MIRYNYETYGATRASNGQMLGPLNVNPREDLILHEPLLAEDTQNDLFVFVPFGSVDAATISSTSVTTENPEDSNCTIIETGCSGEDVITLLDGDFEFTQVEGGDVSRSTVNISLPEPFNGTMNLTLDGVDFGQSKQASGIYRWLEKDGITASLSSDGTVMYLSGANAGSHRVVITYVVPSGDEVVLYDGFVDLQPNYSMGGWLQGSFTLSSSFEDGKNYVVTIGETAYPSEAVLMEGGITCGPSPLSPDTPPAWYIMMTSQSNAVLSAEVAKGFTPGETVLKIVEA